MSPPNPSYYNPYIISIVGGLIVLVIVWILRRVGVRFKIMVERISRHEPDIGGKWVTEYEEDGQTYNENVTINQRGSSVGGEIRPKAPNDDDEIYKFKGTFKHRILTAEYWSPDEKDYERGTFVLQLVARELRGQHILFASDTDELITSRYVWRKKKE